MLFIFAVSDIPEAPPEGYTGQVNVQDFWDSISLEMIMHAFAPSKN